MQSNLAHYEGGETIEEESKSKIRLSNSSLAESSSSYFDDQPVEKQHQLRCHRDSKRASFTHKEREKRLLNKKMRKEARKRLQFESTVSSS